MRKYRGKSIQSGEWVYGDLLVGSAEHGWDESVIFIIPRQSLLKRIEVIPESVGQYLRKDKNGADIYSNMPIRYCDKDYSKGFVWDESGLRWTINDGYFHTHYGRTGTGGEDDYLDLEIISNNPELMGSAK